MTAAELTYEVLDRRNIPVKEKEYWSCWEVSDKEEMGEPHRKTEGSETIVWQYHVVYNFFCRFDLKSTIISFFSIHFCCQLVWKPIRVHMSKYWLCQINMKDEQPLSKTKQWQKASEVLSTQPAVYTTEVTHYLQRKNDHFCKPGIWASLSWFGRFPIPSHCKNCSTM